MTQLDKFLDENRRAIEKENEKKEPTCVMLTEEMSDEEIVEEIKQFREKHKESRIVLFAGTDRVLSESMVLQTEQKQ